jgi:hypothetical protein
MLPRRTRTRVCAPALLLPFLLLTACAAAPGILHGDPSPPAPVVEYVTHQEILTPLPLRVRLPARYGAERVFVFYKGWGLHDWDVLQLARVGQSWSGEISCRAVSTVTGDTRYFFLAVNADGEVVVSSGSPEWPHVATVVGSLASGPRGLAGEEPPMRCHDVADCPPDFPGCPAYAWVRPRCESSSDCDNGERCAWDGYCTSTQPPSAVTFSDDELLARAIHKAVPRANVASILRSAPAR